MEQVVQATEIFLNVSLTILMFMFIFKMLVSIAMLSKNMEVNEQILRTIANQLSDISDTLSEALEATIDDSK